MQLFGHDVTALIHATDAEAAVRLADGRTAVVPASSPDYAEAVKLAAETPRTAVPAEVTNAQARAALRAAGLLDTVQAAIDKAAADEVRDAWEYSPTISRGSSLVASLGTAIGLSPEQIDALFAEAVKITF